MAIYTNICKACNKSFKSPSNRKSFCSSCLIKSCPICRKENSDNIKFGICNECKISLSTEKSEKNEIYKCCKHNEYFYGFNNCSSCKEESRKYKNFISSLDEYDPNKRQQLLECKEHGYYLGGNQLVKCKKCSNKMFQCQVCFENFEDFVYNRFHICDKCKDNLQGEKKGFIKLCKNCGIYYRAKHNFEPCPQCRELIFVVKCIKCNEHLRSKHSSTKICEKCTMDSLKSESVKLYEKLLKKEGSVEKGNILTIPIKENEIFSKFRSYNIKSKCTNCKREFFMNSPAHKTCGFCYKINKCPVCEYKHAVTPKRDPIYCSRKCNSTIIYKDNSEFFKHEIQKNKQSINKRYETNKTKIDDINYKDFNFHGVWYKYESKENKVLDVMITMNISKEYKQVIKNLKTPKTNKYEEMSKKVEFIEFYYYKSFDTWEKGLEIELDLALETEARYWRPAPGYQMKIFKERTK